MLILFKMLLKIWNIRETQNKDEEYELQFLSSLILCTSLNKIGAKIRDVFCLKESVWILSS